MGLLLLLFSSASVASAQCRDSETGRRSARVTLSPLAGVLCIHDVAVFEGPGCGGAPVWTVSLHCSETHRMVVGDEGGLVSLLAPRPSRPEWEIVRLFVHDAGEVVVRSIRFDELVAGTAHPPTGHPRLRLDTGGLHVGSGPTAARVPLGRILTLGRRTGRR